jgi:hypothetical protein
MAVQEKQAKPSGFTPQHQRSIRHAFDRDEAPLRNLRERLREPPDVSATSPVNGASGA